MNNKINYKIKLSFYESILLYISKKMSIKIYLYVMIILKRRKKQAQVYFIKLIKKEKFELASKFLVKLSDSNEPSEMIQLLIEKFKNFYNNPGSNSTKEEIHLNFNSKSFNKLILSNLLQNIGEFRLSLELESELEDTLLTNAKETIIDLILFVQLNMVGNLEIRNFITINGLENILPNSINELVFSHNLEKNKNHSVSKATFMGPMLSNIIELSEIKGRLLIPNPSLELLESMKNSVEFEYSFYFRNLDIEEEKISSLRQFKSKQIIVLEKNNPIFDVFRLNAINIRKLTKNLSGFNIFYHKYHLNYLTFNGINFYLISIILNLINKPIIINIEGVNFFSSKSNYSSNYHGNNSNFHDFELNKEYLLSVYADHNLVQNFIILKKLLAYSIINPKGISSKILSLTPLEYASLLEKNLKDE